MKTDIFTKNVPVAVSIIGSLAIAGLLVSAAIPVWAGESTPAEKAETSTLNQQATTGSTASPDQLNGRDPSFNYATDEPIQTAVDEARHANDEAKYDAAQEQYQAQQSDYQLQQANYEYLRARYERQYSRYLNGKPASVMHASQASLKPFASLQSPTVAVDARVEDADGHDVGYVRQVVTDVDGDAQDVEIRMSDDRSVWVSPDDLSYDSKYGIVVTDIGYADLAES